MIPWLINWSYLLKFVILWMIPKNSNLLLLLLYFQYFTYFYILCTSYVYSLYILRKCIKIYSFVLVCYYRSSSSLSYLIYIKSPWMFSLFFVSSFFDEIINCWIWLVFKLHYRVTFLILLASTLMVTAKQFIGEHIR